jgi:WD40 repeat protein
VCFEPDGSLLTEAPGGPVRWPAAVDAGGRRTFGPPQKLWNVPGTAETTSASADGRVIATACSAQSPTGVTLIHPSRGESRILRPQQDARNCAVSPDGRWVATASFELDKGYGFKIWDGDTGQFIRDLPIPFGGEARFSPDGRWLLTTGQRPRIWKVDGWEEGPELHGDALNSSGVFSADGRLLALGDAPGVVRLLETETGRELAHLTAPEDSRLEPSAFTADGARLVVYSAEASTLHLFDLRALRAELAELGLDWDATACPPAADAPKPAPLVVTVDLGSMGK